MTSRILGVYREAEFSPGKVEADAAILDAVLDHFRARGDEVVALDAANFVQAAPDRFDLVLAMCQSERALGRLAALEQTGSLVINSPLAIRSCYRDRLGAALEGTRVPTPVGLLVTTYAMIEPQSIAPFDFAAGVFVKRGDLHALTADDVVKVERPDRLRSELARFAARGITSAYLQQAVDGTVVKFYGVSGGGYFAAVSDGGTLAASLENALADAANIAAAALGLEIWGGDAIVNDRGFTIVDFNDWPSFSRVRAQAAQAIARRCLELQTRAASKPKGIRVPSRKG
jgi:glutathione synthase/RimK-type ligase-like ATP-grasp enzyme